MPPSVDLLIAGEGWCRVGTHHAARPSKDAMKPVTAVLLVLTLTLGACARSPGRGPRHSPTPESPVRTSTGSRTELTTRIMLPDTTMKAGSHIRGYVVVQNNTGRTLHATGCVSLFEVALANPRVKPEVGWLSCSQRFTIPIGTSTYPVRVTARFSFCGPPPCINGLPAPLPPGEYRAVLFRSTSVVPAAPPVDVRVTP